MAKVWDQGVSRIFSSSDNYEEESDLLVFCWQSLASLSIEKCTLNSALSSDGILLAYMSVTKYPRFINDTNYIVLRAHLTPVS